LGHFPRAAHRQGRNASAPPYSTRTRQSASNVTSQCSLAGGTSSDAAHDTLNVERNMNMTARVHTKIVNLVYGITLAWCVGAAALAAGGRGGRREVAAALLWLFAARRCNHPPGPDVVVCTALIRSPSLAGRRLTRSLPRRSRALLAHGRVGAVVEIVGRAVMVQMLPMVWLRVWLRVWLWRQSL
jgi:hypothetical protein